MRETRSTFQSEEHAFRTTLAYWFQSRPVRVAWHACQYMEGAEHLRLDGDRGFYIRDWRVAADPHAKTGAPDADCGRSEIIATESLEALQEVISPRQGEPTQVRWWPGGGLKHRLRLPGMSDFYNDRQATLGGTGAARVSMRLT